MNIELILESEVWHRECSERWVKLPHSRKLLFVFIGYIKDDLFLLLFDLLPQGQDGRFALPAISLERGLHLSKG